MYRFTNFQSGGLPIVNFIAQQKTFIYNVNYKPDTVCLYFDKICNSLARSEIIQIGKKANLKMINLIKLVIALQWLTADVTSIGHCALILKTFSIKLYILKICTDQKQNFDF